ncbi:MAG TPA: bifunctional alpha,alpha-trehalose-phosphate synthase (UDP-forming)/trehalose-phosphatase [Bacteriovoracaceae bacterium]|nr:bifunctional alpha,alpha-trehalose-phosphate synthase (UDP-forming)/trehalose-phosphatase [Bacteriovoracaceae bacterium]
MARCLIVSNRLPLNYDKNTQTFTPSPGGLVSAIMGLDAKKVGQEFHWLGIMTDDVEKELIEELKKTKFDDITCHPIIVPRNAYNSYYNKYCNNVIWPLFHYERNLVYYSPSGWRNYVLINKLMANAIAEYAKNSDTIWIHDFHLMLVPGMLKKLRPELKIGFFLHIPFPSSEIFRELPQREDILTSLATCDLVGFHDLSYLNHFKSSMSRIIGEDLAHTEKKWGVYPISIDTPRFKRIAADERTKRKVAEFLNHKKDSQWILGVDRLDYIKGLILKLRAYKDFLKKNPDQVGRVRLIQVVIPSRTDVAEYQHLKDKIEQLVSSINGEYGTPTYMPVQYLYHSVDNYELSALYQVSDVLFISSRRDGINLVSLEYVASQMQDFEGSILLSEFAGAHSTLSYAISINPWDIEKTSEKIREALISPQEVRSARMKPMVEFLEQYTSSDWARIFLRDLTKEFIVKEKTKVITSQTLMRWMKNVTNKKVLFFCDLDGTLLPIAPHPSQVILPEETARTLEFISQNKNFEFVIVSGREKEFLQKYFLDRQHNFSLGACHGAYVYDKNNGKWQDLIMGENLKWKEEVEEILKLYTIRTPGSFIEDKGHALTWHFRSSPAQFAEFLAYKLFNELEENLKAYPVQVIRGKKVIEIKSIHANKGSFINYWLGNLTPENRPDIIVALGDDTTDEDMFHALQEQQEYPAFCVKVGKGLTSAKYYIPDQEKVTPLLKNFAEQVL